MSRKPAADTDPWHEAALSYLERFASSVENMRRVLRRRAQREARRENREPDWEAVEPRIEAAIARLVRAGLIDDSSYAELRAETLHRRGEPARRIRARLAAKGVARDAIDGAIETLDARDPDADFRAACRFIQRRRLGPCRPGGGTDRKQRDLAALARAGFDYATAKRALDLPDADAIRAAIGDREA